MFAFTENWGSYRLLIATFTSWPIKWRMLCSGSNTTSYYSGLCFFCIYLFCLCLFRSKADLQNTLYDALSEGKLFKASIRLILPSVLLFWCRMFIIWKCLVNKTSVHTICLFLYFSLLYKTWLMNITAFTLRLLVTHSSIK